MFRTSPGVRAKAIEVVLLRGRQDGRRARDDALEGRGHGKVVLAVEALGQVAHLRRQPGRR